MIARMAPPLTVLAPPQPRRSRSLLVALLAFLVPSVFSTFGAPSTVAQEFIPRKQSRVPGPPLTPQEAIARMQVPEGFRVELVASEPQIMNPVAMAFDDRGRIYVTESFEYPRHEAGPGRDRIKILEDTDGDELARGRRGGAKRREVALDAHRARRPPRDGGWHRITNGPLRHGHLLELSEGHAPGLEAIRARQGRLLGRLLGRGNALRRGLDWRGTRDDLRSTFARRRMSWIARARKRERLISKA